MLHAAFDFPRHPLAREDGERLRGAWTQPPARWLRAHRPDEVAAVLEAAHAAACGGAWVLGGLRYEAAAAFDRALVVEPSQLPLAEFAVFDAAPQDWPAADADAAVQLTSDWIDRQDETVEHAQIERIREYIRAGDCYQVNLTTRLEAKLQAEDPAALFSPCIAASRAASRCSCVRPARQASRPNSSSTGVPCPKARTPGCSPPSR